MEREAEIKQLDLTPVDDLFEHLNHHKSLVMSPLRKHVIHELAFLRGFLMDPTQEFDEDGLLKEVESLASKAGAIITLFDFKDMDKHMALQLCDQIKSILTPMSPLMRVARRRFDEVPKPSRIYYSKTGQLSFVDHLVVNLEHLLKAKADSIGPLKLYILRLHRKLQFVSCRLMKIPQPRMEEADLKDLITSIADLAYEAEYAIDAFLIRKIPIWCCVFWLEGILEEFKKYKRQVKLESGDTQTIVRNIITCEGNELQIIPIVNDTQISEFQLRRVFNHHNIVHTFSIRTWSLVSSYKESKKEFFLQLLRNVAYHGTYVDFATGTLWHASYAPYVPRGDQIAYTSDMSEDELKILVARLLHHGPYFIILADVPDMDVLNDIRTTVLPHDDDGSRVLLTTRSPELALHCRYSSPKDVFSNKVSRDHTSTSQTNKSSTDDDVVGFKAETETMLERLIRGPSKLHIISIVGMPGQGKTTLAKKMYDDLLVVDYFHTRAWCCVSQAYKKRELLLELLGQIIQLSDTIHHKNDEELAEMLYKHLKGQRFLIFLDDVWEIDAWNDLARCFSNDNNGSRIMLTTRSQELASQAKADSTLQSLSPLSDDESWELLRKKVFQKDSFPPKLLEVGRQIAKHCKGLPLAVVLVAGFLKKMEKKENRWKQVAKSLASQILGDAQAQGRGIIELSYKHLPDHLKPCFLYCGAFLEDREVLVSKLIRLWIAEGFIRYTKLKSLEDVAEDYLKDLTARSLVTIAQEKSKGGAKSCRVHDLLHEFCLAKAREEKFLKLIDESTFNLSHGMMDMLILSLRFGIDPNFPYSSSTIVGDPHRPRIAPKRNHFVMLERFEHVSRSLLFFAAGDMHPSYLYDISFMYHKFKFLKILDLEDINIGDSFEAIGVLALLRYLAVQGCVDFIPSSIANLWNLETFLVKGLSAKVVKVPDSIWDMQNLRHVHINDNASFDLEPIRLENSSILDNLQTLSTPSLTYGDDMEKILRRLQGIRKLKCIFLDSFDDATNCNQFPELGFLSQLVSLQVIYKGEGKYPCQFNIPSNLKKLTLSNFRMPWNEISQLASLHNLEVLKLLGNAFEGETWEMEDEVFPKLKFLKLETLNLVKWSALPDHFPCLERLLLHKCEQLEVIPPGIGDIPTLQMIEVMWCSPSAAISTRKIQEEQLDFGNEGLKIQVHPKIWDLESSL